MYAGRMMWGVRRHDIGDSPVVVIMEGNEAQAEENARAMVKSMTEVCERNGWDNTPELVQCRLMWRTVSPEPYPSNIECSCGELIHPDMPNVVPDMDSSDKLLWHEGDKGWHEVD